MKLILVNEARVVTGALESIASAAAERGYDVEICTGDTAYRNVSQGETASSNTPPYRIRQLKTLGSRANTVTRLLLTASFVVSALVHLGRSQRTDVIVLFSQPPFLHILIPLLRRLAAAKVISVQMDRYPDILFAYGALSPRSLSGRILRYLDRRGLKGADKVVCIGRDMRRQLLKNGIPEGSLALIPNWTRDLRPGLAPEAEPAPALEGGLTVLYSGNMGVAHCFGELLDAAEKMGPEEPIAFTIRGTGRRWQEVSEAIARRGLSRVQLHDLLPFDQYAQTIRAADVVLITLREEFKGVLVPSKYYAALSAGRPVVFVGPEESEIAQSIHEEQCGAVVANGDPEALLRALRRYANDRGLIEQEGRNARAAFQRHYTEAVGVERYLALVTALALSSRR
jgi:glycosyltransferase involved in cell wall biosynthesis